MSKRKDVTNNGNQYSPANAKLAVLQKGPKLLAIPENKSQSTYQCYFCGIKAWYPPLQDLQDNQFGSCKSFLDTGRSFQTLNSRKAITTVDK